MKNMKIAQAYFDAWNHRDAQAILATFTEGGTYSDPITGTISGPAIADYAAGLWAGFPDLSFELISAYTVGDSAVAAQWIMRGTHLGNFNQLPPTGKTICLSGADFIMTEDEHISSVQGYFDTREIPKQLGLQIIVQPQSLGPVTFGYSLQMRKRADIKPGAISLTVMQVQSEQEAETVGHYSRSMMTDMAHMQGFISFIGVGVGNQMFTITAWEHPEDLAQVLSNKVHQQASSMYFKTDFGLGGSTSVWTPARLNPQRVRCTTCRQLVDYDKQQGVCACGQLLPKLAYW